jgi:predicted adenylyl cyclase CyaB
VGIRSREELEIQVDDQAALLVLLDRLGFRPVLRYEKRRQTWHLAPCEVTLDELPQLGWFAEIEGPSPAAVQTTQATLGLDTADIVAETYVELTARYGRVVADGTRVLSFADA